MENHHKYYGFKEWKFILSTTLDGRNPESRCSQGQDSGNALEEDSILPLLAVSVEFLAFLGLQHSTPLSDSVITNSFLCAQVSTFPLLSYKDSNQQLHSLNLIYYMGLFFTNYKCKNVFADQVAALGTGVQDAHRSLVGRSTTQLTTVCKVCFNIIIWFLFILDNDEDFLVYTIIYIIQLTPLQNISIF